MNRGATGKYPRFISLPKIADASSTSLFLAFRIPPAALPDVLSKNLASRTIATPSGSPAGMDKMLEIVAKTFVLTLEAYGGAGLLFALFFVSVGVQRLDSEAKESGIGFRFLILPGVAAFWPMFLQRWIRGVLEPPVETNPHRFLAGKILGEE
jgi:hypothetical protein